MYMFLITYVVLVITSTNAEIPSEMTALMDKNIKPCEDFYRYACGGWLKTQSLKRSQPTIGRGLENHEHNEEVVRGIMEENHPILREFWHSCLDVDKITALGNNPLQRDLRAIMNTVRKEKLMMLAGTLSRVQNDVIAQVEVRSDRMDASTYAIYLKAPKLTLPSYAYSDESFPLIRKNYHKYINRLMKLAGFRKRQDHSIADTVIGIETMLAAMKKKSSNLRTHSIQDLITRWPLTIGSLLTGTGIDDKAEIHSNLKFHVQGLYFNSLENMFQSMSIEDLKVYVAFIMVNRRTSWLGNDFAQLQSDFLHSVQRSREQICIEQVITHLPDLIGKYFYKKEFDKKRQKHALEVTEYIQNAMKNQISRSTMLKPNDKKAAVAKLKKILPLVGKSPVSQSYPFSLSHDNYPGNMYTILSHDFDNKLRKLGRRVNREEWSISSATLNARYDHSTNAMYLPAAIFQPPFNDGPNFHPAYSFGSVGFTIGHELTHGFDTIGLQYDKDGNVSPLWDVDSLQMYDDRAKCWEDKFSSFKVHGEHGLIGVVDGQKTLHENIADHGGIALAWDAYHNYMTKFESKSSDITYEEGDQMFFLAYAQEHCFKADDETKAEILLYDTHAPHEWRVNGVMMNNDQFAKVFKCEVDSPMNPIDKCKLW